VSTLLFSYYSGRLIKLLELGKEVTVHVCTQFILYNSLNLLIWLPLNFANWSLKLVEL